ncbi:hypothetical protein GCM10025778_34860 [Paeniglutamicibacter antarcticus]|uniref:30S ribosomal protein S15 n=1 Tax=Paeniglutamicibacter antarcticus TaxID=494023 RepID=A0ABP9TQV0_9MICC
MAPDAAVKQEIVKVYATNKGDTGSQEIQIAVMSHRISTCPTTRSCTSMITIPVAA